VSFTFGDLESSQPSLLPSPQEDRIYANEQETQSFQDPHDPLRTQLLALRTQIILAKVSTRQTM